MRLENISFEVSAVLGSTQISMQTYGNLQVGDIIVLDQEIEKSLNLQVGFKDYFLVSAGLFETHKAVIIDERIHA